MSLLSDTTKAVQGAPGVIQGFLTLATPNRLRRELRETMDLYERAVKLSDQATAHPEVSETAATLARLMKKEANDLHAAVGGPLRIFQPDWRATGALGFLVLLLVFCDALLFGSGVRAQPLGWALMAVVGVAAVVLAIVLVFTLLQAVRGPRRTIITGIPAEDLAALFGMASSPPNDATKRGAEPGPPDARSKALTEPEC